MNETILKLNENLRPQTPEEATRLVLCGLQKARLSLSEQRPMQNGCLIRAALPNDAEELSNLYKESFPGYPFAKLVQTTEGHRNFLEDQSQLRVIIISKDTYLAAAALGTIPPDRSGEIKQVVVRPKYRGMGLCLPLLETLTDAGKMAGLQYLYMDVRARMQPMQKAALKAGFTAIGLRAGQHIVYHQNGPRREHMIHMVKLLNGAQQDLDLPEYQSIDPAIVAQLKNAGILPSLLLNHSIWK